MRNQTQDEVSISDNDQGARNKKLADQKIYIESLITKKKQGGKLTSKESNDLKMYKNYLSFCKSFTVKDWLLGEDFRIAKVEV